VFLLEGKVRTVATAAAETLSSSVPFSVLLSTFPAPFPVLLSMTQSVVPGIVTWLSVSA